MQTPHDLMVTPGIGPRQKKLSTSKRTYTQVIHKQLITQNKLKTIENKQFRKTKEKLSTEKAVTYYYLSPKSRHTKAAFWGDPHALEKKPPRQQRGKKTHKHISKRQKSKDA